MDKDKILDSLQDLINIYDKDIREKDSYRKIVADMEYMIPDTEDPAAVKKVSGIFDEYIASRKGCVKNAADGSTASKITLWNNHVYMSICRKIRDDGIGYVSDYYIKDKCVHCTVHIRIGVRKKETESVAEYEKRKDDAIKKLIEIGIPVNDSKITDSTNGRGGIIQYFTYWLNLIQYNICSRNGKMDTISLVFRAPFDIHPIKQKTEKKQEQDDSKFTDAEMEKFMKDICKIKETIEIMGFSNDSELQMASASLIKTIYVKMCESLGISNRLTSDLKKTQDNTNEMEQKINSRCNPHEVLYVMSNMSEKIEDYFMQKYCMQADINIGHECTDIRIKFSSYRWMLAKKKIEMGDDPDPELIKKQFDLYEYDCLEEYYLSASDKNYAVLDSIAEDMSGKIHTVEIGFVDDIKMISSAVIRINNMSRLPALLNRFFYDNKKEDK